MKPRDRAPGGQEGVTVGRPLRDLMGGALHPPGHRAQAYLSR